MSSEIRVFLCYARADAANQPRKLAWLHYMRKRIVEVSKIDETEVFLDTEHLELATLWARQIDEALGSCQVMVCMVSPNFLASVHCANELGRFFARIRTAGLHPERRIIPVILESVRSELPVAKEFQFVDRTFPDAYGTGVGQRPVWALLDEVDDEDLPGTDAGRVADAVAHAVATQLNRIGDPDDAMEAIPALDRRSAAIGVRPEFVDESRIDVAHLQWAIVERATETTNELARKTRDLQTQIAETKRVQDSRRRVVRKAVAASFLAVLLVSVLAVMTIALGYRESSRLLAQAEDGGAWPSQVPYALTDESTPGDVALEMYSSLAAWNAPALEKLLDGHGRSDQQRGNPRLADLSTWGTRPGPASAPGAPGDSWLYQCIGHRRARDREPTYFNTRYPFSPSPLWPLWGQSTYRFERARDLWNGRNLDSEVATTRSELELLADKVEERRNGPGRHAAWMALVRGVVANADRVLFADMGLPEAIGPQEALLVRSLLLDPDKKLGRNLGSQYNRFVLRTEGRLPHPIPRGADGSTPETSKRVTACNGNWLEQHYPIDPSTHYRGRAIYVHADPEHQALAGALCEQVAQVDPGVGCDTNAAQDGPFDGNALFVRYDTIVRLIYERGTPSVTWVAPDALTFRAVAGDRRPIEAAVEGFPKELARLAVRTVRALAPKAAVELRERTDRHVGVEIAMGGKKSASAVGAPREEVMGNLALFLVDFVRQTSRFHTFVDERGATSSFDIDEVVLQLPSALTLHQSSEDLRIVDQGRLVELRRVGATVEARSINGLLTVDNDLPDLTLRVGDPGGGSFDDVLEVDLVLDGEARKSQRMDVRYRPNTKVSIAPPPDISGERALGQTRGEASWTATTWRIESRRTRMGRLSWRTRCDLPWLEIDDCQQTALDHCAGRYECELTVRLRPRSEGPVRTGKVLVELVDAGGSVLTDDSVLVQVAPNERPKIEVDAGSRVELELGEQRQLTVEVSDPEQTKVEWRVDGGEALAKRVGDDLEIIAQTKPLEQSIQLVATDQDGFERVHTLEIAILPAKPVLQPTLEKATLRNTDETSKLVVLGAPDETHLKVQEITGLGAIRTVSHNEFEVFRVGEEGGEARVRITYDGPPRAAEPAEVVISMPPLDDSREEPEIVDSEVDEQPPQSD